MRMTTAKDLPKACFLCGRNGTTDPLDAHHIFGGANRKLSEKYALVVPLCHNRCHENGKDAVHRNAAVAQAVHEFGQRLCMERMGWSIEEFRAVFGRNYLQDPLEDEDSLRGTLANGDPSGGPISFQTGALAAGRNFPRDGKVTKGSPGAPSERFPGTPPPGQGRKLRVSPIGSSFQGAGDGGREAIGSSFRGTGDEGRGFEILDEEVVPAWV